MTLHTYDMNDPDVGVVLNDNIECNRLPMTEAFYGIALATPIILDSFLGTFLIDNEEKSIVQWRFGHWIVTNRDPKFTVFNFQLDGTTGEVRFYTEQRPKGAVYLVSSYEHGWRSPAPVERINWMKEGF